MINIFKFNLERLIFYKFFLIKSRTRKIINEFKLDKKIFYSWGMKRSGKYVRNNIKQKKVIFIEDGFVHSFGIKKKKIPFTICYDNNGIYYDCKSNNDLKEFFKEKLSKKNASRTRNIVKLWKEYSISKYNFPSFIEPPTSPYVLLIDQIFGDLSLAHGDANANSFKRMFEFASNNWPDHKIVIKIHPDVINHKKKGCIHSSFYLKPNVIVLGDVGQINKLIEKSAAVCVVTSQVGFEALIYGKDVHVFGRPFYSGLGLTIDHKVNNQNLEITLDQLVFSSLVKYQICIDPRTKKKCEIEEIMKYISNLREASKFFPKNLEGINFTPWKVRQINRFFYPITGKRLKIFRRFKTKMQNIIVWGKNIKMEKYISKLNNYISVEDGFIRSVGLGAELYPPLSLLFDKKGIHYDASRSSDLEYLLQNFNVNHNEIIRARRIIDLIIKLKISKYNLRLKKKINLPINILNKQIIGVLGQVETDNSIIYGVPEDTISKTNFALVEQVRKDYPDAYIIYKPHPDTESGLRIKGIKDSSIFENADFIANKISVEHLFNKVDRVAVFTSLGGFEALLRGISVSTYGLPFYAGWGLTDDKLRNHKWAKRRTRKLTIEELTFITLAKYPLYSSVRFNCLTEVENIIEEIIESNEKKTLEQFIFKNWGFLKERWLTRNK